MMCLLTRRPSIAHFLYPMKSSHDKLLVRFYRLGTLSVPLFPQDPGTWSPQISVPLRGQADTETEQVGYQ